MKLLKKVGKRNNCQVRYLRHRLPNDTTFGHSRSRRFGVDGERIVHVMPKSVGGKAR